MTDKPDEDLLDDALERLENEDLGRVKSLTAEGLRTELAEKGWEPGTGLEIARHALAGGGPKTGGGDEDLLGGALDRLEKEDLERVKALDERALAEEAKAKGWEPDAGLDIARQALAKGGAPKAEPIAKVVPLPSRRLSRWLVPAAIAASFAALLGLEGEALVAWIESTGPNLVGSARDAAGDEADAKKLRDEAREDYRQGRFEDCLKRLDEAWALDHRGDLDPNVTELRKNAAARLSKDGGAAGTE
jgi:hypothetical protein